MTFRSDLDALRARHDALESEVAARQQDLAETRHMIEEVQRRASLPVLDGIRVAAPCTADWAKMEGDERVRACGACNRNVYNLSEMTRDEAQALIRQREGRLCVRYYRRADGTILFGDDCAVGVRRRRGRRMIAAGAALLAATGALAYGAAPAREVMEMGSLRVPVSSGGEAERGGYHVVGALAAPPERIEEAREAAVEEAREVAGEQAREEAREEARDAPATPARGEPGRAVERRPGRAGGYR